MSHGSSTYADLKNLQIEIPRGWREEYTRIVLEMLKPKDGFNNVSIEKVKSIIVDKMIERDPKVTEHGGETLLESKDIYGRDFDAHFFHFLLKKLGHNKEARSNTGIMDRFTRDSIITYWKWICALGIASKMTEPGTKDWHYVLQYGATSGGKFRCITCGETELLVTFENMTEGFRESRLSDVGAYERRVELIAGLVALRNGKKGTSYTATKTLMDSSGVKFIGDWPNGMPGEAK